MAVDVAGFVAAGVRIVPLIPRYYHRIGAEPHRHHLDQLIRGALHVLVHGDLKPERLGQQLNRSTSISYNDDSATTGQY